MADISLLPEEMKKKEDTDRAKSGKHAESVVFHIPGSDVSKAPASVVKTAAPGLFERLFGKKPAAPAPATPVQKLPTVALNAPAKVRVSPPDPAKMVVPVPQPVRPPPPKPVTPPPVPVRPSPPPAPVRPPPPPIPKPVPPPSPKPAAPQIQKPALHMAEQVSGAGIRVSLIPTVSEKTTDVSAGVRTVAIATVVAFAVSALAYGGAYWYVSGKRRQVAELDARAKAATGGMLELRDRLADARTEAKRLKNIRTLLDEHLVWTNFFGFLEKNTHKDIAFNQFSTQGLDTVTMQAEALDYRAIAEQVQAISVAPGVVEVKAGGISALVSPTGQITSVKLTLTIKFKPEMIKLTQAKGAAAN